MTKKHTPPPPDAHAAGTYSRTGNGDQPVNRFAEVQRKSAEARAKLNVASQERARTEDQRAADDRRDFADRDRDIDRERHSYDASASQSAVEKAAAQLGPAGGKESE